MHLKTVFLPFPRIDQINIPHTRIALTNLEFFEKRLQCFHGTPSFKFTKVLIADTYVLPLTWVEVFNVECNHRDGSVDTKEKSC